MKTRSTIYIESSEWDEFKKICDREGEAMCQKIESFIRQYNEKHRIGNPQTIITKFSGEPISTAKCFCGEEATHHGEAENGWKGFLCLAHFQQSRDARLLKRWKREVK